MPKPPPGYKHNRTEGFPLADLEMLFGHVLNAVGSDLATAKSQKPPPNDAEGESRGKQVGGPSVGNKRSREGAAAGGEGGGKRRSVDDAVRTAKNNGDDAPGGKGQSSMEVEDSLGGDNVATKKQSSGESVESKLELESESSGPAKEGLEAAKKAFCRVLGVWEGVATEGKRNLHQRVVARLGRMLVQTEAGAIAQRENTSQSEVRYSEDRALNDDMHTFATIHLLFEGRWVFSITGRFLKPGFSRLLNYYPAKTSHYCVLRALL